MGPRKIAETISEMGFDAHPISDLSVLNADYLSQKAEVRKWRNSFIFSLIFTIPSMVAMMYFMMSMDMMPSEEEHFSNHSSSHSSSSSCCLIPGLSSENFILFLLATPVQFFGGRYFYIQAYKALKHRIANMDVLIMLATNIAYFYSLFVLIYFILDEANHSPKTFFEAPPMLLSFISLGRWLEHIAKGKTSEALAKLMSLQPTEAILVEFDPEKSQISAEKSIDVELVERGDYLKVIPGELIKNIFYNF